MSALTLPDIDVLVGSNFGRFDVACPSCGPFCSSPSNRHRRVLRIWREEANYATYRCARCEIEGYAHDQTIRQSDPTEIEKRKAAATERQRIEDTESLKKAQWLWSSRRPIIGSSAETYLRKCRGFQGRLPGTLGFLPGRGEHGPAMIAAFGLARETFPGELVIHDAAVRGVHLTKLKIDGSGKAGTDTDKLTIGSANRSPIMLAPVNDALGLAICEGVEDALTVHDATGLGAWAAGTAGRLPAMAESIPAYVEAVTLMVDDDEIGRRNATKLRRTIGSRLEVRLIQLAGAA